MASSSSSSHLIPTSFSQSWNHDVFLSFRGEDTRKNFVDHLYTALVQRGIQTYKDDETLARGESIGPALLKAIKESGIAVVVFSENYADSSWCLNELVHIIECMDTRGQIVMPVFYDVDPSDVRKQKGKYGKAFEKHEQENKDKVESWRKALLKAGNLSGWVPKDFANGHEAKCIEDIVGKISSRLSQETVTVNDEDLIGIETRLQDLKSMLEIGSGGVHVVGIWGVGGGGKSTLASAAYTEISHQFEAHCLLHNIREESSKDGGLERLKEKLISSVLKTNIRVGSEIERRLRNKSVLVVLDDVSDLEQLEALVESRDRFGSGSRIIITTRDKHVLTRHANKIYEVSLLSQDEAMKLFRRHAYKEDKPVEDYEMLSKEVVFYAGGLPLALKVLGSFLYDKNKNEWMSALAKLKDIPNDKVTKTLKISYDGLEADQQQLFLDIACFFRRRKIGKSMKVLEACSFYPVIGVKVLIQKSLIKDSNGIFDMHDLIEEMAHHIVRGEHPNNPEKWSRIWKSGDAKALFAMGADAPLMETEVFVARGLLYSDLHPWAPHAIANMKNLRWIRLKGHLGKSLPSNFQPTNLGILMLKHTPQKELWHGYKHLPNLKIIDLFLLRHLIRTPDFNGLPCLEKLILEGCKRFKKIHPSIGYLKRLVYVNMTRCSQLPMFPPIIQMPKLETLILCGCTKLRKFPDFRTNMDSLVTLDVSHTGIKIIPSSVGQFCTNLVSLDLYGCRIESNFYLLKSLEDLMKCTRVQSIHQDSLRNLRLPQSLIKLNLNCCNLRNGDILLDVSVLLNLQELTLSGNSFSRLHSSLSRMPRLKFLEMLCCRNLVELPDLPSSIAILYLDNCESLQSVGDLSKYKLLWKVEFRNTNKIDGEKVLHTMVEVSVNEDHFMTVSPTVEPYRRSRNDVDWTSITLLLPHNWYNDFSGFLLCALDSYPWGNPCRIVIEHEMSMDSQPDNDHWEEFIKNPKSYNYSKVGYVPFGSSRDIPWWNFADSKKIKVCFFGITNPKIGLVPRKSKQCDSRETAKATKDYGEFWEEEYEMVYDSKSSSVTIIWSQLGHRF